MATAENKPKNTGRKIDDITLLLFDPTQQIVTDWADKGNCSSRTADDLYVDGTEQNRAKRICSGCPVKLMCLYSAVADEDPTNQFGVWGGKTDRERRRLIRSKRAQSIIARVESTLPEIIEVSDRPKKKELGGQIIDTPSNMLLPKYDDTLNKAVIDTQGGPEIVKKDPLPASERKKDEALPKRTTFPELGEREGIPEIDEAYMAGRSQAMKRLYQLIGQGDHEREKALHDAEELLSKEIELQSGGKISYTPEQKKVLLNPIFFQRIAELPGVKVFVLLREVITRDVDQKLTKASLPHQEVEDLNREETSQVQKGEEVSQKEREASTDRSSDGEAGKAIDRFYRMFGADPQIRKVFERAEPIIRALIERTLSGEPPTLSKREQKLLSHSTLLRAVGESTVLGEMRRALEADMEPYVKQEVLPTVPETTLREREEVVLSKAVEREEIGEEDSVTNPPLRKSKKEELPGNGKSAVDRFYLTLDPQAKEILMGTELVLWKLLELGDTSLSDSIAATLLFELLEAVTLDRDAKKQKTSAGSVMQEEGIPLQEGEEITLPEAESLEEMKESERQIEVANWLRTFTQNPAIPKDQILGRGIRFLRFANAQTTYEFADVIGVNQNQFALWENGTSPDPISLNKVFKHSKLQGLGADNKAMQYLRIQSLDTNGTRERDNEPMSLATLQDCTFGYLMRYLRRLKGLTQEDLGRKLSTSRLRIEHLEIESKNVNSLFVELFITLCGLKTVDSALAYILRHKAEEIANPIPEAKLKGVLAEQYLFKEYLDQLDPYPMSDTDRDAQPLLESMSVAERVNFLRERKEWTIEELAEKASIHWRTITYTEKGQRIPKDVILVKIIKALGYSDIHNPILLSLLDQVSRERAERRK